MDMPTLDAPQPGAEDNNNLDAKVEAAAQEADLLREVTKDFRRLQRQKSRKTGGVEARVLQALAFLWGEHYVSQQARGLVQEVGDANKLYLVFNLIESGFAKLMGRLTALGGQFYSRPDKNGPKAQADGEVVDKLILATDEKVDQASRTWELVFWLGAGGTAFEYVPWIPNVTIEPVVQFDEAGKILFTWHKAPLSLDGSEPPPINEDMKKQLIQGGQSIEEDFEILEVVETVGDIGSEILGPLNVFIDQSVRSVADLAPDQAIYIAKMRTKGWIEETYGDLDEDFTFDKELKIVTTSIYQEGDASSSLFLKDMIPTVQGELQEGDPDMAVVVERFQPSSQSRPKGRLTCFIPGKKILLDADNPYEEIPIVDFHFRPVTTTFWTKDYVTDLIAPQKFLNKRLSQLGEQSNASIYDTRLLGGSIKASDVPTDKPGVIENAITEQGIPLVQRLPGPQLPQWFLQSIELVQGLFGQIEGGRDLFQESSFPGQLRGPMAIPMLQEILDTQWGPLYKHIGRRMARVKQMRINRVKQFYPPIRTLHYTDRNERDEVLVFHNEEILRAGTNFNITVEDGTLLPELRSMQEDRMIQRLSGPLAILYTDDRTGRLDKSKIAAEMGMGTFGREGREAQSRRFQAQIVEKMWKNEAVPPVMQFWEHEPMLDELEAAMMTTEFIYASPQIQQAFQDRWNQHVTFMQQMAEAQQATIESQMVHSAVAQATQQTAAQTAAAVAKTGLEQVKAQASAARGGAANPPQQQPSAQQMTHASFKFGPSGGGQGGPPSGAAPV